VYGDRLFVTAERAYDFDGPRDGHEGVVPCDRTQPGRRFLAARD
jgi:hypothetical protein